VKLKMLKEQMAIRYSKELYLGYGKGVIYHFFYGYKRFLIEILRCFITLFRYPMHRSKIYTEKVSICATNNQRKALLGMPKESNLSDDPIHIYNISFVFNVTRLVVWVSKLFIFPFIFVFSDKREGAYFCCNTLGMAFYNRLLINKLQASGVKTICISNDHAGDIFIISLLLREVENIRVVYVQHGAVKNSFPRNHFDLIYVLDEEAKDVYKHLSLNERVEIHVLQEDSSHSDLKLEAVDVLVCFSHQFYLLKTVSLFSYLSRTGYSSILVRFHPSDRLVRLKLLFIGIFCRVSLSGGDIGFEKDFSRSRIILSASSSLLKDSVTKGISHNLVWYKPIGLTWDYYSLEDQLLVATNTSELEGIVGQIVV